MAKILNWMDVAKKLKAKGILLFNPLDLQRLFPVSKVAVNFFLHRNTKKGFLIRLKKSQKESLYALADSMPPTYLIANRLYEPSYISLDTALSFHQMIPETIYTITSVSPRTTRGFEAAGISYRYFRIKKDFFTGYKPISYQDVTVLMAEPEKALADYLYFASLGKRELHYDRFNFKNVHHQKLKKHILLFARPKMFTLLDEIYAQRRES